MISKEVQQGCKRLTYCGKTVDKGSVSKSGLHGTCRLQEKNEHYEIGAVLDSKLGGGR